MDHHARVFLVLIVEVFPMIGRSAGGVARTTYSTTLVLLAVVSAACGASQVSPPPATPAASARASAPASPTLAASPSTVTTSPGVFVGVPGNLVDIGGRSLYLSCIGESAAAEPTVVFENGLGSPRSSWTAIQRAVAGTVRACAYDRAGIGPSDRADNEPRTVQDLADDLEMLLDRAEIHAPYVFVGHSLGPWVTTLFTVEHPDAVVGQVFVDPRGPGVTDAWLAALPPAMSGEPEALTSMRDFATSFSDPSAKSGACRGPGQ